MLYSYELSCSISQEDELFYLQEVHKEYVRDGEVSEMEVFDQLTTAMRLSDSLLDSEWMRGSGA